MLLWLIAISDKSGRRVLKLRNRFRLQREEGAVGVVVRLDRDFLPAFLGIGTLGGGLELRNR